MGSRRCHHASLSRGCALALLLAAGAACTEAGGEVASAFTTRDSAGIRIAESTAPAWGDGEAWRIGQIPILEIGMADGPREYMLSGVVGTVRRDDGAIIIANGGSGEIRFYGPDGTHLRSVGGEGSGPGEFRGLFWITVIRGDSIVAYDAPARRISVFTPDGEYVRSTTLDRFESYPQPLSAFEDGSLPIRFDVQQNQGTGGNGPQLKHVVIVRASPVGELLDTLVVTGPLDQYRMSTEIEGGRMSITLPVQFGASIVAEASSDRLIIGRNDRYWLSVYRPSGEMERVLHRRIEPRPVTDELARAELEQRTERVGRGKPAQRKLMEEMMANRPRAEVLPFFMRIVVDESDNTWVQEYVPPGEDRRAAWTVFDGEGRMLGDLLLPENFTPHDIGEDFILGVAHDELDVERVQVYALQKPPS